MNKGITVIIPAYNEEKTIGQVIDKIRDSELETDIIVINNCSTDKTAQVANSKGVKVIECNEKGKGNAMDKGLKCVTTGIALFVDGDLEIHSKDIVKLMTQPIVDRNVDFVKSAFEREGGRVTELVAKPLLELLFPNVSTFEQPLSGIIAGKVEYFNKIIFEKDYGVDIGILLDMINLGAKVEEVHIGKIDNNSKSWSSLSKTAKEVANAILKRKGIN